MNTKKTKTLADAPLALNKPDQPWEISIENNSIVARWRWMDAVFFSPGEVSDEAKRFTFTATLNDNGTWTEMDSGTARRTALSSSGATFSTKKFVGRRAQKSITIGLGKNRHTGETGIVGFKLDTARIKTPIRDYLAARGWKKAGLLEAMRHTLGTWLGRS